MASPPTCHLDYRRGYPPCPPNPQAERRTTTSERMPKGKKASDGILRTHRLVQTPVHVVLQTTRQKPQTIPCSRHTTLVVVCPTWRYRVHIIRVSSNFGWRERTSPSLPPSLPDSLLFRHDKKSFGDGEHLFISLQFSSHRI